MKHPAAVAALFVLLGAPSVGLGQQVTLDCQKGFTKVGSSCAFSVESVSGSGSSCAVQGWFALGVDKHQQLYSCSGSQWVRLSPMEAAKAAIGGGGLPSYVIDGRFDGEKSIFTLSTVTVTNGKKTADYVSPVGSQAVRFTHSDGVWITQAGKTVDDYRRNGEAF